MNVLLDTNIILDALQSRDPWYKDAQQIFLSAANRQYTGFLTAKSLLDIHYLMHRSFHNEQKTRSALQKLLSLFTLLDTTAADCQQALLSGTRDYEDAVMIETASRSHMDYIVTRNPSDFSSSRIPVLLPGDFLTVLRESL